MNTSISASLESRGRNYTETPLWKKTKQSDPHSFEPRLERHSNSLVSQSDLFLRRKLENESITHETRNHSHRRVDQGQDETYNRDCNRGRERKRGRGSSSRNGSPSSSRTYDMRGFQNQSISEGTPNSKPYFSNIDHLGNIPKVLINYKSSLVATENKNIGVRDQAPEPDVFSRKASVDYKARAIQVVGIFRQLANLSNQVTQETEVQTREERKVELYTELSSTLSNISAIGAASIMPNLADMALKNAERKQRIDVHFKSIAQLWEQAFEIFAVEISRVLNNELEKSVKEICQAADLVGSSLVVSHSPPSVGDGRGGSSIQKGLAGKEEEPTFARNEHISQQEHKRRRYAPPSPVPNETPIMGQQPVREEIQQSVQEILSQMKLKIDEQTQSLQMLMKENYELKTSLQGQMSTSLQSSNYSSHSSHGLSKGGMTPTVSPDQP